MFRRQRFLPTQVLWIQSTGPAHKSCIKMKQFILFLDSGLKIEYIYMEFEHENSNVYLKVMCIGICLENVVKNDLL